MTLDLRLAPKLIKPSEAAELLNVSVRTIHSWIEKDTIPYVALPGGEKPTYRIPLRGLLRSLSGNYDLTAEVEALYGVEVAAAQRMTTS